MQQKIKLELTADDIQSAKHYGLDNTLLYLLAHSTGTLWRISDCGVGVEIMSPYRSFILGENSRDLWKTYQQSQSFAPCELEIYISEPDTAA